MTNAPETLDGTRYYLRDSSLKATTYLWADSRLALSTGYTWTDPSTTFGTATLPQIDTTQTVPTIIPLQVINGTDASMGGTPVFRTTFQNSVGSIPAGISRSILSTMAGSTQVFLPLNQVCINDWDRARTLNHNFELPKGPTGTYTDIFDGAGHFNDESGVETFSVQTVQGTVDPSIPLELNPLPSGISIQGKSVTGPAANINATSVVIKQQQVADSIARSHWRRMSFSSVSSFEVISALNNMLLPQKLLFNTDPNTTIPASGGSSIYGQDQTTNPEGTSNYFNIMGGVAPYTVKIEGVVCRYQGTSIPTYHVFRTGLSSSQPQFLLGLTDSSSGTPSPVYQGVISEGTYTELTATGEKWSFVLQGSRCYIKSMSNGGSFIIDPTDTYLPLEVQLSVTVRDANGLYAVDYQGNGGSSDTPLVFTIPVLTAPTVPQVVAPQTIIPSNQVYTMTLGPDSSSPTLSGYPFNSYNAPGLFRTDLQWWRPEISPRWDLWSSTTAYAPDDHIYFEGGNYTALLDSTGVTPTSPGQTSWEMASSDTEYSFKLIGTTSLPQGGPVTPTLFERLPTYVNSVDPAYYDYIEVQRALSQFVVAGPLGLSGLNSNSLVYPTGTQVTLPFKASGGTPPYSWVCDINNPVISSIAGSVSETDSSVYNISGVRRPSFMDTFPESHVITITVTDSSTPFHLAHGTSFTLTFTSPQNMAVITNPYLASDFAFYVSQNSVSSGTITANLLAGRTAFPWSNSIQSSFDYANDYSDGLIPGGAQIGFVTGVSANYTVQFQNLSSNEGCWKDFKYKMPMGLCFGVAALPNGGYDPAGYYQILPTYTDGGPGIAQYVSGTSVVLPAIVGATATIQDVYSGGTLPVYPSDGNGVNLNLYMKAGDLFVGAINRLGTSTEQFWELGYIFPHFELQTNLATPAPRDSGPTFDLAISDVYSVGSDYEKYHTNFVPRLLAGDYDKGVFDDAHSQPYIGLAYDTLRMTVKKQGSMSTIVDSVMPIHEEFTAKFWVASTDMWLNPSYYWLGACSKFKTQLNNLSQKIYFGFTECDRILQKGAFPPITSPLFPQVQSGFVNFYLTDENGVDHPLNQDLHSGGTFSTAIQSCVSILQTPLADPLNMYLDYSNGKPGPLNDPARSVYFLGPRTIGSSTPSLTSPINHPTLTEIDRGFRTNMVLDSKRLWEYLNSTNFGGVPLEVGTQLHMVWMFLLTRPNIALNGTDAINYLDQDMMSAATGLNSTDLQAKIIRGRSYTRVPVHIIIQNGAATTLTPPVTPSGPSVSITAQ